MTAWPESLAEPGLPVRSSHPARAGKSERSEPALQSRGRKPVKKLLVSTALAVYAVAEYSVPVVPAFVLLATVGVLGRYRPLRGRPEAPSPV